MSVSRRARLNVEPGRLGGVFDPPGDKSITHRAILLALLARGESAIANPNPGADAAATLACAQALGLEVVAAPRGLWKVRGTGGALGEPARVLDCGNSGTTLRLLAGVLAAQPFLAVLVGDESLQRRPVARVIDPLRRMGATLQGRDGDRLPPLVVRGGPLRPIEAVLPVASAQVASAILFAGIQTMGETIVTIPGPARDHTERLFRHLGAPLAIEPRPDGGRIVRVIGPWRPEAASLEVPGDLSAAAFFLAAAAGTPGARVTARGVGLNPTRNGLLEILEQMGARVTRERVREVGGEEVGDVTVEGPDALRASTIGPELVPRMIDEVPAWAVVAALARGTSRLAGAAELRVKESDRLAAIARNLEALGIDARETEDGLAIEGGAPRGGTVRAEDDHRIAMAFAVLATRASGPVAIEEAGGIVTSDPGFADTFRALGGVLFTGDRA